ncbi:MAG: c-type cytochrome [Cytophagaceae bacterium]
MKSKVVAALSLFFLASCAAVQLATPAQTDVNRVKTKYPDYTLAQLNDGKALYEKNCANCHALKNPSSRNEEEWKQIVPGMTKKANKKGAAIDAAQQELILRYVITMSLAGNSK